MTKIACIILTIICIIFTIIMIYFIIYLAIFGICLIASDNAINKLNILILQNRHQCAVSEILQDLENFLKSPWGPISIWKVRPFKTIKSIKYKLKKLD